MKRICLIFIFFVFSFFMFGCKNNENIKTKDDEKVKITYEVKNFDLASIDGCDYVYFDFIFNLNKDAYVNFEIDTAYTDSSSYNKDIVFMQDAKTIIDMDAKKGENTVRIGALILEEVYEKNLVVSLYIKDENIKYDKDYIFKNILSLAEDINEGKDENHLSSRIIKKVNEKYYINTIEVEFDYLKKEEVVEKENYRAEMRNPDYDKITVTITLKNNYKFSSSFNLTLNGESVNNSKYTIEDNILTYIFDDPNWTPFY